MFEALPVTDQAPEHRHEGDGEGGEVHHDVGVVDVVRVAAPDLQQRLPHLLSDELPRVFIVTLDSARTLLVGPHIRA